MYSMYVNEECILSEINFIEERRTKAERIKENKENEGKDDYLHLAEVEEG